MCGICGFIDNSERNYDIKNVALKMINAVRHRGPDSVNVWLDNKKTALCHARLSIIDLSQHANQPFVDSSGNYILVFNGEIYNYLDIKRDLQDVGVAFRTSSDTEVLLYACIHYGIAETLRKLNGMFAFALYDKQNDKMILARDRIGKKPLFYALFGNLFLFSSELKSMMKHPSFVKKINPNSVASFLKYAYIHAPNSIFSDVYKLEAGHYLEFKSGHIGKFCYWDITNIADASSAFDRKKNNRRFEAYIAEFDELLSDAVKIRMISDVPFGAFLSGGVDSSLVTAVMQRNSSRPIKTFSIGFNDARFDESLYAREVASILGTEHTELTCSMDEAKKIVPLLSEFYDEPFADQSQIPTMLLAKLAKNHVTVALSGDGGDELFGGYDRYFRMYRLLELKNSPQFFQNALSFAVNKIPPHIAFKLIARYLKNPNKYITKLDSLYHYSRMLGHADNFKYLYCTTPMSVVGLRDNCICSFDEHTTIMDDNGSKKLNMDVLDWFMLIDQKTYLVDDILQKVDRATMAYSLEARNPLLDHRIVEFSWNVPRQYKIRKDQGKILMKKLLSRYIPDSLIDRPKQGFSIPLYDWLKGDLFAWANELILSDELYRDDILNHGECIQMWRNYLTGNAMHTQSTIWSLLMYLEWKKTYSI